MFGLVILTGLLLGFSFPFTGGLFPLTFIALVPLLMVNFSLNNNPRRARILLRFLLNYIAFLIFNTITTWWIYYASEGGMYMAILANSLIMAFVIGIGAFIARQLGENKGLFAIAMMWLAFEHVHYFWELSWPWLNFGHIFGNHPMLIQWYEYSGVSGGTLWVLLVNIFIYIVIRNVAVIGESMKVQMPNLILIFLAFIIPISSSVFIYTTYEETPNPVDIVIVQPNIEANTEKFVLPAAFQLEKMFSVASAEITDKTDLVVCPETAIPYGMDEDKIETHEPIGLVRNFMTENHDTPVLIGADTYGFFDEKKSVASRPFANIWYESYNTALMIQPNQLVDTYHKAKLVLGGEKLPFIKYFPFLEEYSVELGGTSGLLGIGEEPKVFQAKGVNYAPLICYESVYGDYASYFARKGAEIFCVITNDGWWEDTPGYKQHRMFSQIRAIENRRAVARSANTGISCFIDQKGEIISELGWNEYGVLHEVVNRNTEITFFTAYGSFIGRISCYLAIAMFLYGITTRLKKIDSISKIFTRK